MRARAGSGPRRPETGVRRGAREAVVLSLVYFVFAASFGNYAVTEFGLPPWYAAGTTILAYGIQAQIAAFKAMQAGENLVWIVLLVLAVNVRFMLMSASMAARFRDLPLLGQLAASHLVANGSFAAAARHERVTGDRSAGYFLGFAATVYAVFALGALVGALMGAVLPPSVQSVTGFVLPAFLLAMIATTLPYRAVFTLGLVAGAAALTLWLAQTLSASAALLIAPALVATAAVGVDHAVRRR
ncbi:AzlC family ABC transporter permease [Roseospira goensis]|uniref:Putative branched-subunit amino acid permease n=1 Tax=Roseospira goensis TaxID=391922 RepID=A0A7W6RZF9_9PROT|nr:AzlC family ABC transporter permease [Roseospira goensis]MBB4285896.1 putative branched-subunit amino acid permease [Roseospira goensis]